MPNIKDVAEMAGVSVMTVSRVLNNKGYVSEQKRRMVLASAKKLNYQPNMIARSLVLNRTSTVGVLLSHIENPVYAQYVASMSECFRAHGMDIILSCAETLDAWQCGFQTLLNKQVDGLILLPSQMGNNASPEQLEKAYRQAARGLRSSGKPCVTLGDHWESVGWDVSVRPDYRAGAEMAVDYLISMGHRKIGNFRYARSMGLWGERMEGFDAAAENAGLTVRPEWIYSCGFDDVREARQATMALLSEGKELPTAICCANDAFAVGAMQALNAEGIRVPEDISLIGHDGSVYSRCSSPYLTTISIQPREVGKKSAERLLNLLEDPTSETGTVLIPPVLQPGGTVKRIQVDESRV